MRVNIVIHELMERQPTIETTIERSTLAVHLRKSYASTDGLSLAGLLLFDL